MILKARSSQFGPENNLVISNLPFCVLVFPFTIVKLFFILKSSPCVVETLGHVRGTSKKTKRKPYVCGL